jgi:predicted transcriptional regulator
MLLSFKPEWYNLIKDGIKIYEYRRTFQGEEILAYMYVSSPMKMIVGKIHLGKKINLNTWKEQYKEDVSVCERIDDFLTRHTYVMPILSFQMTKEITLTELRKFNPDFTCPQMYYYLENYPDLFEYIRNNAIEMGEKRINSFEIVDKEEICRKNYH